MTVFPFVHLCQQIYGNQCWKLTNRQTAIVVKATFTLERYVYSNSLLSVVGDSTSSLVELMMKHSQRSSLLQLYHSLQNPKSSRVFGHVKSTLADYYLFFRYIAGVWSRT